MLKNNMKQFEKFSMLEHKETITSADTPQMIFGEHQITVLEISDEEIYKASHQEINHGGGSEGWIKAAFRQGAVWYREQLKKLNEK